MSPRKLASKRIVIVGGGVAGLSIAIRLAQSGFPVMVLEASRLGCGASTRNQGWLYSGAWFAPDQLELARFCRESLQQTLDFCPECIEADVGRMVYLMAETATDPDRWTAAWDAAGLGWKKLLPDDVFQRFPGLALSQLQHAYELPDRAMRTARLLRRLAEAAAQIGVEIRTGTPVSKLIEREGQVEGVETMLGEVVPARLVLLAGNAKGGSLLPGYGANAVGAQSEIALVALKTHLVAVQPAISRWPLCVVDAHGFNHVPHGPNSVFGSNRWLPVGNAEDEHVLDEELLLLWNQVRRFFPDVPREKHSVREWAGNTVQAMRIGQAASARLPLPAVVDHAQESPSVQNLLSVFPGRASLWPQLAEQARRVVLEKLTPIGIEVTIPPWGMNAIEYQSLLL